MNFKTVIMIIVIILLVIGGAYYYFTINKQENIEEKAETDKKVFNIQNMKIEVLQEGSSEPSKTGDLATVHYIGTLENGTKFDSSVDRGTPFDFTLGENRVIQGWELGVLGMKVGEKRKLTIPPELGYGASGYPPIIPA